MGTLNIADYGLSDDSFDQLEQAIAGTKKVDEQIKLAKAAGIDVGNSAELNRENRAKLMKIKQTYWPGR